MRVSQAKLEIRLGIASQTVMRNRAKRAAEAARDGADDDGGGAFDIESDDDGGRDDDDVDLSEAGVGGGVGGAMDFGGDRREYSGRGSSGAGQFRRGGRAKGSDAFL